MVLPMKRINKARKCRQLLLFIIIGVAALHIKDKLEDIGSNRMPVSTSVTRIIGKDKEKSDGWLQKRQAILSLEGRKKVMLFCYMRGGSTFFSEFFRNNPQVLYWYEPFDAFYNSEFGEKTWHFPQDIFWYQHSPGNSTLRIYEEWELDDLAMFSHNLLSCNFNQLPVEFFFHKALSKVEQFTDFRACLFNNSKNENPTKCQMHIKMCTGNSRQVLKNNCPARIKAAQESMLMHNVRELYGETNEETDVYFLRHAFCRQQFYAYVEKCMYLLENKCKASQMVAYKALRVTMKSVKKMLQMDPDLYVIYYVRDPRGTVASRVKISHTYRDTNNSHVLEAKYHCRKLMKDIKIYNRLKFKYPNSILLVKYEDLVMNPFEEIKRIYNFYGMCVHENEYFWLNQALNAKKSGGAFSTQRRNITVSINSWRSSFQKEDIELMNYHCKDALIALNYNL